MTGPSLIILGTDAVLAAAPSTPVQLAHACNLAGYAAAIPASWGDELIAARVVEQMARADGPRVQCSCPLVTRQLAGNADSIASMLMPLVSPPVATAEYLRAIFAAERPRITFTGACPGGAHPSIDRWMSPAEFLKSLADLGIDISRQPTEFDGVMPPDRRRYYSEAGGRPSAQALSRLQPAPDRVELSGDDLIIALADQLFRTSACLVDLAVGCGCACSGATMWPEPSRARAGVRGTEPPAAPGPVVDHAIPMTLEDVVSSPKSPAPVSVATQRLDSAVVQHESTAASEIAAVALESPAVIRRRSSPGLPRPVLGAMPLRRADTGRRSLPRAYVARRRSSPRGMRATPESGADLSAHVRWIGAGVVGVLVGIAIAWLVGSAP